MNFKKYYINIVLVFGIVIFANLVFSNLFVRFDFTEDDQYTLSKATKKLLENLEEPVTIKAYFSDNLPPNIERIHNDFKDMLIEYANRSKGQIIYNIVNPNSNEDIEKEAKQDGIQPVLINVREKDQMKQQKAYMGAVIKMGDRKEVIPFMQPETPIEYTLSSSIKKISLKEKPTIGLIQGQGEPTIEKIPQVKANLEVLYNIKPVLLNDSTKIPEDIKTLVLIKPTDSLTLAELSILDNFIAKGGNLFLALNRVKANLNTLYASEKNTMLNNWLKQKGINIEASLVADVRCGNISVQQQNGMFRYMTQIKFPYIPIFSKFSNNPIVKGLEGMVIPFISPISFTGDTNITFTPLIYSSKKSTKTPVPFMFNIQKQWTEADLNQKNIVVAAAFNGKIKGNNISKMVVIGNGDFVISEKKSQQQIQQDNISFCVNSIDWLSDDTGLIELRTKGITSRPIEELEDGTKTLLKYLNFLLPIILIILYGLFNMQRNKNIRLKRKEENYG